MADVEDSFDVAERERDERVGEKEEEKGGRKRGREGRMNRREICRKGRGRRRAYVGGVASLGLVPYFGSAPSSKLQAPSNELS